MLASKNLKPACGKRAGKVLYSGASKVPTTKQKSKGTRLVSLIAVYMCTIPEVKSTQLVFTVQNKVIPCIFLISQSIFILDDVERQRQYKKTCGLLEYPVPSLDSYRKKNILRVNTNNCRQIQIFQPISTQATFREPPTIKIKQI